MSLLHKKHDDDFSGWCNIFISTVKAKEPQGHEFSRVFLHRLLYSFHIRFTSHELMVSFLKCVFVESSWLLSSVVGSSSQVSSQDEKSYKTAKSPISLRDCMKRARKRSFYGQLSSSIHVISINIMIVIIVIITSSH